MKEILILTQEEVKNLKQFFSKLETKDTEDVSWIEDIIKLHNDTIDENTVKEILYNMGNYANIFLTQLFKKDFEIFIKNT